MPGCWMEKRAAVIFWRRRSKKSFRERTQGDDGWKKLKKCGLSCLRSRRWCRGSWDIGIEMKLKNGLRLNGRPIRPGLRSKRQACDDYFSGRTTG